MNRKYVMSKQLFLLSGVGILACPVVTHGQSAWLSFIKSPSSISAANDVIFDLPCNASCTGTCTPLIPCANVCACACEKDIAVGDLNGDNKDDLVIVRMQPFYTGGGVSNLLFLNVNGVMTDSTSLVDGFADLTQDRDVVIIDVDRDISSTLNMPDVVTAPTNGNQPRVYMNLGCCSTTCSPSNLCATANRIECEPGATWCGLKYDATENRLPTFSPGPKFCGVAAGDLNGDNCPDLYFGDYGNALEDRLLLNTKDAQTGACTGIFEDKTTDPPTRLCPDYPNDCFYESNFTTGVQIIDMDLDSKKDIVKTDSSGELLILYNDPSNVGYFDIKQDLENEYPGIQETYMVAAGDMNNNGGVDLYHVSGANFRADRFLITECFQADPLPPECTRTLHNLAR